MVTAKKTKKKRCPGWLAQAEIGVFYSVVAHLHQPNLHHIDRSQGITGQGLTSNKEGGLTSFQLQLLYTSLVVKLVPA